MVGMAGDGLFDVILIIWKMDSGIQATINEIHFLDIQDLNPFLQTKYFLTLLSSSRNTP